MAAAFLAAVAFPLEPVEKFVFCSFTHILHLAGEMQSLACHRVVEVHKHRVFLHLVYGSLNHSAFGIEHRYNPARYKEVAAHYSVEHEGLERQLENVVAAVNSIAFFRRERKFKLFSRLFAINFFFETRQEHSRAVNVL